MLGHRDPENQCCTEGTNISTQIQQLSSSTNIGPEQSLHAQFNGKLTHAFQV
jgi:hypothetical protein